MKFGMYIGMIALSTVIFWQCEMYQTSAIDVPDVNFLNTLIEQGVDKNGVGMISTDEAEAASKIYLRDVVIADITGLEAFINLDTLICITANLMVNYPPCALQTIATSRV